MKRLLVFVAIVLFSTLFTVAQTKESQSVLSTKGSGEARSSSRIFGASGLENSTQIEAELIGTIDARKAKVGDEVVLKTTKSVKQGGKVIIEKGAKLRGRITDVTQKSKGEAQSKLAFVVDQLDGGNFSVPITASIVSMTDSRSSVNLADSADLGLSGSSSSTARTSGGGGGGGLLGGVGGTVGSTVNTAAGAVGDITNTATGTGRNVLGTTTRTVGGTLNGVQLNGQANGSVSSSGSFTAQDKNVRLEKGLNFGLLIQKSEQQ